MSNTSKQPVGKPLLDRSDVRVKHAEGVAGTIQAFVDRVRSGDLGSLPVVIGLILIWGVFSTLNPIFLSPTIRLTPRRWLMSSDTSRSGKETSWLFRRSRRMPPTLFLKNI